MAKLKTKLNKGVTNTNDSEVVGTPDMETNESESKYMNQEEKKAIEDQKEQAEKDGASTERMKRATALVSERFNLDNTYHATKFDDKGKVVSLSLESRDFVLNVQIKDSEKQGMVVYE